MDNWRLTAVRITKYDPKLRNADDSFSEDEWTSVHDVGKIFEGKIFTLEEYLRVESYYIKAVEMIISDIQGEFLQIENLEKAYYTGEIPSELTDLYEGLRSGMTIHASAIGSLLKLILREFVWCELVCMNCIIHFGYDYYMYVNGVPTLENGSLKQKIEQLGLFVD